MQGSPQPCPPPVSRPHLGRDYSLNNHGAALRWPGYQAGAGPGLGTSQHIGLVGPACLLTCTITVSLTMHACPHKRSSVPGGPAHLRPLPAAYKQRWGWWALLSTQAGSQRGPGQVGGQHETFAKLSASVPAGGPIACRSVPAPRAGLSGCSGWAAASWALLPSVPQLRTDRLSVGAREAPLPLSPCIHHWLKMTQWLKMVTQCLTAGRGAWGSLWVRPGGEEGGQ